MWVEFFFLRFWRFLKRANILAETVSFTQLTTTTWPNLNWDMNMTVTCYTHLHNTIMPVLLTLYYHIRTRGRLKMKKKKKYLKIITVFRKIGMQNKTYPGSHNFVRICDSIINDKFAGCATRSVDRKKYWININDENF